MKIIEWDSIIPFSEVFLGDVSVLPRASSLVSWCKSPSFAFPPLSSEDKTWINQNIAVFKQKSRS